MPFTRSRPTASELLTDSQSLIQGNFNSSDDSFGIDHYKFSNLTVNNGMHKIIHQTVTDNSGNTRLRSGSGATTVFFPGATAGIEQSFAANYTPDTTSPTTDSQLFSISGNGTLFQLTGNLIGTPAGTDAINDGYAWMGGILLQWGIVQTDKFVNGVTSGTVTFKDRIPGAIGFPNNIFTIQTNALWTNSSGSPLGVGTVNVSRSKSNTDITGFNWQFNALSNKYVGFTWLAIGN